MHTRVLITCFHSSFYCYGPVYGQFTIYIQKKSIEWHES